MAVTEIREVLPIAEADSLVLASSIDQPTADTATDLYTFHIGGWALGRDAPVSAIDVVYDGQAVRRVPLQIPRVDVTKRFPKIPHAGQCGFWTTISVIGFACEFEVQLNAVLRDDRHSPFALVRGRHHPMRSSFMPKLQPVMLTSLGRMGTTWLARLLAFHPQIVAHRSYPYEARSSSYWLHMLKVLSEPANLTQSTFPDDFHENLWWIGHHPSNEEPITHHTRVRRWFGRDYVEELAAFCLQCIEEFYSHVGVSQRQRNPAYFLEKFHPGHIPQLMWELYPRAREIVLVRDFRDVVCSILAFNAKRGRVSFGREYAETDEEFVLQFKQHASRLLQEWKSRALAARLVRYEDLILDPEETLRALLEYLALDASPRVMKGMLERASKETNELRMHRTSRDARASIGRWRRELKPSLQAICMEAFGDVLKEFGYGDA